MAILCDNSKQHAHAGGVSTPVKLSERHESILLVDDNPTNLQVLLQTLTGRGNRLLIAQDGESALRIARKARPVLVLLDIMMPGIDGYEVCRRLKADSDIADIAVIFLSALDDLHDRVCGLEAGAVDYIAKPFQAEEVIARVNNQLKICRLEQALAAHNRELQAANQRLLQTMNEGVFEVDKTGEVIFVNPAACRMTGWHEREFIGCDLYDLLCRNGNGAVVSPEQTVLYQTLVKGVVHKNDDGMFRCYDGSLIPIDFSCTPIKAASEEPDPVVGAVVVFRDITEKKRQQDNLAKALAEIEQQRDKLTHMSRLSSMGEMASGFAHEVNQPLTAISNYAQVCRRLLDQEPVDKVCLDEAMEKVVTQAQRAGGIISRICSFVRKPEHYLEPTDCNRLVEDVVKLAEVDARNNQVEIHLDLAGQLPEVKVDPVQIQQVVLNLIRNAMEAMKDQATRGIGVRLETHQLDQHRVRVRVIDRGYGFADDAEERLFSPFYTTKGDGMGIGLSVCHSIIRAHGGTLQFERNPEGGAILWFTVLVA